MRKKKYTEPRPAIPPAIQNRLWGAAGGRCQFKGCNKSLLKHEPTKKKKKLAEIGHIISYSPDGPRGHRTKSKELATEFDNLMLLCPECHKLVDGKEFESQYSVELLTSFKQDHEKRVERLTSYQGDDYQVHILIFKAKIHGSTNHISISKEETLQAIEPYYTAHDEPFFIDLTNADFEKGYGLAMETIDEQVKAHIDNHHTSKEIKRLAVFALAPMPLLMYLGKKIGNKFPVWFYQRHRDTENWIWKDESIVPLDFEYILHKPEAVGNHKKVCIALSLSGKIQQESITEVLGADAPIYEITIPTPNTSFLTHYSQIKLFEKVFWNDTLQEINRLYPDAEIHLFPACPSPIALVCGKVLLSKVFKLAVYDFNRDKGGFIFAISL